MVEHSGGDSPSDQLLGFFYLDRLRSPAFERVLLFRHTVLPVTVRELVIDELLRRHELVPLYAEVPSLFYLQEDLAE